MERVICFIDANNLFHHLRSLFGNGKVNHNALCHELAGSRPLLEWRYYTASLPEGESDKQRADYEAQQRFFHFIKTHKIGSLHLGRLMVEGVIPHQKLREKGVDVLIAIDMVQLAAEDRYDTAILLSADEDLVPAVKMVQDIYKKRVEVAMPEDVQAFHLGRAVEGLQAITKELYDRVEFRNGHEK